MKQKGNVLFLALVLDSLALVLSISPIFVFNGIIFEPIDPEAVNGIITVSAIISGFATISFRDKLTKRLDLLFTFAISIYILVGAGYSYYIDLWKSGSPSVLTLVLIVLSLLIGMNHCFIFKVKELFDK